MKKLACLLSIWIMAISSFCQQQTYDLITFTPPKKWVKDVQETVISYTVSNNKTGNWCRISIIKSTASKGSIEKDFESEWQELIVNNYKPADTPQLNNVQETDGWKIKTGVVKFRFNNSDAVVSLTTATGYGRCASIVVSTNSQDYHKEVEALLTSVVLKKGETLAPQLPAVTNKTISILGTWCISSSDQSSVRVNNGVVSTIFRQYSFAANGSYTCTIKTFDPVMSSILLGRETGSYAISGDSLTITPRKSVLEEWSKKGGRDEWGKLLKTQNVALEKRTYQIEKLYIAEINEWQLILIAPSETKRDGPFNNSQRNAWVYIATSPARPVIKLPN
ncbi:MAG TPA: hypothetical protein VL095_09825 [Flavisolibacter sp.]|nr:hypothetical protein [Flavisolibacter sp.]